MHYTNNCRELKRSVKEKEFKSHECSKFSNEWSNSLDLSSLNLSGDI